MANKLFVCSVLKDGINRRHDARNAGRVVVTWTVSGSHRATIQDSQGNHVDSAGDVDG